MLGRGGLASLAQPEQLGEAKRVDVPVGTELDVVSDFVFKLFKVDRPSDYEVRRKILNPKP